MSRSAGVDAFRFRDAQSFCTALRRSQSDAGLRSLADRAFAGRTTLLTREILIPL